MVELEIKVKKHSKRLITEIKQNIKHDIQTTEANDNLKEHFEIQAILTGLNKHKHIKPTSNKFKKPKTPQAIEDLADLRDLHNKLIKLLDKSK